MTLLPADGRLVKIGGASAMWGDSAIATPQLLTVPGLNYLSYDYLAETTMSIMARAKARNPQAGYATDFVAAAMAENLAVIAAKRVKVLSNAGGLNPEACRAALLAIADKAQIKVNVAVVQGDDILDRTDALRRDGWRDLNGAPLPSRLLSANAYLGARAIASALDRGADIVITGRVVDSAFALAALVHEFGWRWDDWDKLAQATLAGHIIECGAQGSGGLFTDWDAVPDWANIGYPVVECASDGSFTVTKPDNTGGLVVPAAVAEQVLYEIGDPAAYVMPDVTCDFREVRVAASGPQRVRVTGACGRPAPDSYKVSATWQDGYRLDALMAIRGIKAAAKAEKTAAAVLERTRAMMAARGFGDYSETLVELLGTEALYGPHARARETREVVLRLAVRHPDKAALEFLRREVTSPGTSMGPGTRGHFGGRSDIQPIVRLCSFLVSKAMVTVELNCAGTTTRLPPDAAAPATPPAPAVAPPAAPPDAAGPGITVPLARLAYARSGDKGNSSNIGVIPRQPGYWPYLAAALSAERVAAHFAHLCNGAVDRYILPGLPALNFVLQDALGGGGMASLRSDPLGKSFAQILLDLPVQVPRHLLG